MNICKSDIYFIIVLILIIYLYLNQTKTKEGFQIQELTQNAKDSITQIYKADIEAIRNLSNIATQLTTNNTLTMPGALKIKGRLSTNDIDPNNIPDGWSGGLRTFDIYSSATIACGPDGKKVNSYITAGGDAGFTGNLILEGDNKWIFHTPDDGRKNLMITPWNGKDWEWDKSLNINNDGTLGVTNNLSVANNLSVGGNLLFNNFYRKYMNAGIYQVKAYGRYIDLKYGWMLLWEDDNVGRIVQRLTLYEKKKTTNGFVLQSTKDMRYIADGNYWSPYKLTLFPGYCARFYYWSALSNENCKFNSGNYEWTEKKFSSPNQCVHLIHITLDSEGISNFDDLTCANLINNGWKQDVFPPY